MDEVIDGLQGGPSVVIEHITSLKVTTQLLKTHGRVIREREKASEVTEVCELMEILWKPRLRQAENDLCIRREEINRR